MEERQIVAEDGRPWYSLDRYYRQLFGRKVYKLSLDGGFTCPNRDGTLDSRGCSFCSAGGSGDFSARRQLGESVREWLQRAQDRVAGKCDGPYIAYFQAFTNTYAPVEVLRDLFTEVLEDPMICGLSIATRPDCLEAEKVELLAMLAKQKPVWVELGLQTIWEESARAFRRGYELSVYERAVEALAAAGISVVTHIILGLPGETEAQMLATVDYVARQFPKVSGIKLSMLHVLKGTDMGRQYEEAPFPVFAMDDYIQLVVRCIERLPAGMVVHRMTGDGPKKLLLAPAWSGQKKAVLNGIAATFRKMDTYQGKNYVL